jgi:hypothetical protein
MLTALLLMSPLLRFSIQQWRQMPEMHVKDAYKWLYHATLGGEHAVQDDSGPRQWLESEWPTVGKPLPNEPEIVPLRPDGKIVRINLRPYKHRGGDEEMMLAVFVASARAFKASRAVFIDEWQELGRELAKKPIGKIDLIGWNRLDRETRSLGYPAIDHSTAYEKAYHPAYRVVLRSLWP